MISENDSKERIAPEDETVLPQPMRERWQPLRSGFLNIFRYESEEFHFRDGRLLLRGNNGSGKSRVLALQLPFLLDGEISPHRVEPDGDPAKRIEWNLLMGRYPDRLGYTWIEFGRRTPEGEEKFLTLGCGLRATQGKGLHSRWFFITPKRIGRDLFLENESRQPLGRERLEEEIGGEGQVFRQPSQYRRAVDEALFKLGTRYEPLIELLIRLRQPQLSRKLDEKLLSKALSEALRPLPEALIDEVAESFRGLEADREELNGFADAGEAAEEFLREYRHYIRTAARRRAEAVRGAHSTFESTQRLLREAERSHREEGERVAHLEKEGERLDIKIAEARQAVESLRDSPEMRRAEEVVAAQKAAEDAANHSEEMTKDAAEARISEQKTLGELEEQKEQEAETVSELSKALANAEAMAEPIDLLEFHRKELPAPSEIEKEAQSLEEREPREVFDRRLRDRREAAKIIGQKNLLVSEARQKYQNAEAERRRIADALSEARERETECRRNLAKISEDLFQAYRVWRKELIVLEPPESELLREDFFLWSEQRDGNSPLREAIQRARDFAINEVAEERAKRKTEETGLIEECEKLRKEIDFLESGQQEPPVSSPTRPAPRDDRPGAPFWKTCDFHEDISTEEGAAIEAALEAAGLLDAWLLPDGTLLDPETEDAFISRKTNSLPKEKSLARWLRPALDRDDSGSSVLTEAIIQQVFASIGGAENIGEHWVSESGTWQLGPLSGRWSKKEAEYIGETSRAAARRRRISELREILSMRDEELSSIRKRLAALMEREARIEIEVQKAPVDGEVNEAGFALTESIRVLSEVGKNHESAERIAAEARTRVEKCEEERDREALDLGLSEWIDRLAEFRENLSRYETALAEIWPRIDLLARVRIQTEKARLRCESARKETEERNQRALVASRQAAERRRHFETLEATQGVEARVVREKLKKEESFRDQLIAEEKNNERALREAFGKKERAAASVENYAADRSRHESVRAEAISALQLFAEERLLGEADEVLREEYEGANWPVSRAVDLARRIEQVLVDEPKDEKVWQLRQQTIHQHIQELRDRLIPQGYTPDVNQLGDVTIVRVAFRGRILSINELRDAFISEISERQRLLNAREKEVIENHLLGEAAVEIQQLIRDAENWVTETNRELAERPTSSGMLLRFLWETDPDGPPGIEAARRQLLRTNQLWTPEERDGLARFLQEQIEAQRNENPSASWRDHLDAALDYRAWHRFAIERKQDDQWRRLTRRTYGTGSGGEKAIALTLPQFAAAAAHYRSAAPEAPRLILLDEVFVGIDSEMRAHCMGLLHQFDLDFVMTSEREWGCYATIPELAICQLSARPGFEAIAITRWRWYGNVREREILKPAPRRPENQAAVFVEGGLFDRIDGFDSDGKN